MTDGSPDIDDRSTMYKVEGLSDYDILLHAVGYDSVRDRDLEYMMSGTENVHRLDRNARTDQEVVDEIVDTMCS